MDEPWNLLRGHAAIGVHRDENVTVRGGQSGSQGIPLPGCGLTDDANVGSARARHEFGHVGTRIHEHDLGDHFRQTTEDVRYISRLVPGWIDETHRGSRQKRLRHLSQHARVVTPPTTHATLYETNRRSVRRSALLKPVL